MWKLRSAAVGLDHGLLGPFVPGFRTTSECVAEHLKVCEGRFVLGFLAGVRQLIGAALRKYRCVEALQKAQPLLPTAPGRANLLRERRRVCISCFSGSHKSTIDFVSWRHRIKNAIVD